MERWSSGGVVGAQRVVELDAGRADAPAGAGAAEQSPDGPGVRPGGVGVGVETNGGEVVGRGVLVGEGVDRGEGGRCGVSAAPGARSLPCSRPEVAVSLGSAVSGGTQGRGRRYTARPVVRGSYWSCRQPGRVGGSQEPPARGGGAGLRAVA